MSQRCIRPRCWAGKLNDLYFKGGCTGPEENSHIHDAAALYDNVKDLDKSETVIIQNTQKLRSSDSLFYTPVKIGKVTLGAMLDSGSMACSLSAEAQRKLNEAGVVSLSSQEVTSVVFVGCGGIRVRPKSVVNLEMEVYGCSVSVPTFVVENQRDELIIGSNVIRYIVSKLKGDPSYWEALSTSGSGNHELQQFLSLLAGLERWSDDVVPDKVGTVRCNRAVTLTAGSEHLVWGTLPKNVKISPGSTVMTEPTSSHSAPRGVMVARVVTPLWGDRWVPLKILNLSDSPITLRRNAKLADVYTCLALEDMEVPELRSSLQATSVEPASTSAPSDVETVQERLVRVGLGDLDLGSCDVSADWRGKLTDLVLKYEDVFSRHNLDCGEAKEFVHRIRLTDERPFRLPYRRVPPAEYQKLRQVLTEMEEKEIIRKSASEFASPLVLVWKKNGDLRVCTDFRWLNKRTLKDAHPLPHQADCLAALGGNAFFSTMDLTSGFYNMPLHEDDRKYSAFTTPMGLYEYNRLPQGLCNSPGSFMRMMTSIFGDQNFLSLLCYLDDLLVFAPTEELALERLELVFSRLRLHNLKLAQKKCWLLRRSVKFLGHIIDGSGVSTDATKVEAVSKMTTADLMEPDGLTPSQKRVRSFLGMVNYYQHFVPNYSAMARPLFELLAGQKQKRKGRPRITRTPQSRRLTPADWTADHQQAFEGLKAALVTSVVLAHPDFTRPFVLCTDASLDGLGAVLSQVQEGDTVARPVAFASKSLSRAQKKYPAHRLEFLALKWSVCDKFSHWLKGHVFTVWTDNNPLTHIMTKPRLDACEQRWVAKLASYVFDIKYIPGPKNTVADALSRRPFAKPVVGKRLLQDAYSELLVKAVPVSSDSVQEAFRHSNTIRDDHSSKGEEELYVSQCVKTQSFSKDEVSAILETHSLWESGARMRAVNALQHLPQLIPPDDNPLSVFSENELREGQLSDPILSRVLYFVERDRRPSRREKPKEPVMVIRYLKHWEKLTTSNGILYRVSKDQVSKKKRYQFVVPDSLKSEVLKGVHDSTGHQGQFRSLSLARQRFFWPHIDRDVKDYVRKCSRCVISKTPDPEGRAPLESIKTSAPLEIVCIDFWTAEDSNNKSVDVLVVTDHFTRLAQAFPCRDQSAKQVAKQLWDKYFCVYGFPERIHSDQGASFESHLISELLKVAGVRKSRTTPYHPMGNGSVERFNRTLGNMIRALPPDAKHNWPRHLQTLTFMYNCTVHETTGYPPFYLMYGRVPRLPVDVLFKNILKDPEISSYDSYVVSLTKDLQEAMAIAQGHVDKEQGRQAELYNRRVKGKSISAGDRVLVSNKRERGKRKTADRWESTVYIVVSMNASSHTYRIRNPVTGQERVVHRNLLMLVNFLPVDVDSLSDQTFVSSCENESSDVSDMDGMLPVVDVDSLSDQTSVSSCEKESNDVSDMDGTMPVVDEEDARTRTHEWVSNMTTVGVDSLVGDGLLRDVLSTNKESEHVGSLQTQSQTESSEHSHTNGPTADTQGTPTQSLHSSHSDDVHITIPPSIQSDSSSIHEARSRAGRILRPVKRLLYQMSQWGIVRDTSQLVDKANNSMFQLVQ